jgi:predicted nucleic acid-binding Zn ribbon protein
MTTHVYEAIPQKPGEKPEYFELQQSMNEAPLTKHPTTGQPVRRVVPGGYGVLKSGGSAEKPKSSEGNGCCGPSGCRD